MLRFLAGVLSTLLLVSAGFVWWSSRAHDEPSVPPAPPARLADGREEALATPPEASSKTREERRFGRYDKDKDGSITRAEYLASRRKAYAKLDVNGDGRLSFDEWAARTTGKFAQADRDRSGALDAAEFLTTRVIRKPSAGSRNCPPPTARATDEEDS